MTCCAASMNASTRPRCREGTASWPTIPMTKPPNRRLAIGAPRRADPLARRVSMSDRRSDAFERALDEAGRRDNALDENGASPTGGARMRGVALGLTPGSGGRARFGLALDWTDEPTDPAPPQT